MLISGPYKFCILEDGGCAISGDLEKCHAIFAAATGQKAIASGILLAFNDGTYEITQPFSDSLGLYEFTSEHREALAKTMRGAYLMRERGVPK